MIIYKDIVSGAPQLLAERLSLASIPSSVLSCESIVAHASACLCLTLPLTRLEDELCSDAFKLELVDDVVYKARVPIRSALLVADACRWRRPWCRRTRTTPMRVSRSTSSRYSYPLMGVRAG